jgi:predicted nucleic acid-binding protein
MYLVGSDDRLKAASQDLLERAVSAGERLVTDAEVFQEILHRFVAIRRRDAIEDAFDVMGRIVDETFPIELADVEHARRLLEPRTGLSARDAIHLAVMQRRGIGQVMSFDRGFDGIPGVARLGAR